MPNPWSHSRPGWMGLWATWSRGRSLPIAWSWNYVVLRVPFNPNHSMIIWFVMFAVLQQAVSFQSLPCKAWEWERDGCKRLCWQISVRMSMRQRREKQSFKYQETVKKGGKLTCCNGEFMFTHWSQWHNAVYRGFRVSLYIYEHGCVRGRCVIQPKGEQGRDVQLTVLGFSLLLSCSTCHYEHTWNYSMQQL